MGLSLNTVMTVFYETIEKEIDRYQKHLDEDIKKLYKQREKGEKANQNKIRELLNAIAMTSGCVHALTQFMGYAQFTFESELERILREQGV